MKLKTFICILSIPFISCNQKKEPAQNEYGIELSKPEAESIEKETDDIGELISTFSFEVKTNDPDFEDGKIPWASIEKPQEDSKNLINKDDIIVPNSKVTVIIDYPLKNEYRFNLESTNGFSRETLLIEISKHYYQIYKEEENSATIKTLPMEKRAIANRNETNGKYGIWGHDIADLVLTDISIYKTTDGKIILVLGIDS